MSKTVFDFKKYRDYLKYALPISGPQRGARTRLADTLGCQSGFISLVLSGAAQFSLEHAAVISRVLKHDNEEKDFFLLLVHLDRAGSKELENYYQERIQQILESRREIKSRIKEESSLTEQDRLTYYSHWYYTAIHMCLLVPEIRTREKISRYLRLPLKTVSEVLKFFDHCGLAIQRGNEYIAAPNTRIHLPNSDPLISKHHTNWRMQAINSLDHFSKQNLHYTSVMSISKDAAEKIRVLLLEAIAASEPIIREAKDEGIFALAIDLFNLEQE